MKVAHRKCETCSNYERCHHVRESYMALFNELDDKYKRTAQTAHLDREVCFEIYLDCFGYTDEEAIVY